MMGHRSDTSVVVPEPIIVGDLEDPVGDEFCHILTQDLTHFYCGRLKVGDLTCKMYEGEAICPTCGRPTCPTCAVQSSLNARLEGTS